ncbi:MAG: hypothetical protein ACXABO_04595 [Promethearchaeota archaeon]
MEIYLNFLTDFLTSLRNEVLEYYNSVHLYLKDLVSYKNIDLKKNLKEESEEILQDTILKIIKAIKTGLNTIGVSINKLSDTQDTYLEKIKEIQGSIPNYNTYLELYLNDHINKLLFEILMEYLYDVDVDKIKTLNLFKLITQNFNKKLQQFKEIKILATNIRNEISIQGIEEYLNFSDLTIKIELMKVNPKKKATLPVNKEIKTLDKREKKSEEQDILTQLQNAKNDFIETLKTPKRDLIKSTIQQQEKNANKNDLIKIEKEGPLTPSTTNESNLVILSSSQTSALFIEQLGKLQYVDPEFAKKININIVNLINSRVVNPDFLDLENLFYYISILKMLNIEFPFTPIEIIEILKNYISKKIFSSSKSEPPDPVSIFYGLAIITELNLIYKTNVISLDAVEEFLKTELRGFMPEKLKLNYYTLLSLKLLARNEVVDSNRENLLNPVLNLDLSKIEEYNPTFDIYNKISIIKIIDKQKDLSKFIPPYISEIKKELVSNGSIDDSITKSSITLLILDLLNLKDQESAFCSRLLNYILNTTKFFSLENLNRDFNWRIDKIAYKIELRMLFWALLACSQYKIHNFINF